MQNCKQEVISCVPCLKWRKNLPDMSSRVKSNTKLAEQSHSYAVSTNDSVTSKILLSLILRIASGRDPQNTG